MVTRTKGTRFERDYSEEEYREPGEGYNGEEPTKGLYPFRLVDLREHTSQSDNESLHWTFEMTEDAVGKNGDSYAGWRGHLYTNDDAALWKEQQIMVALRLIKPRGKYRGTLESVLQKGSKVIVMGRVIRERYIPDDGGEGEWRAKLTSVMIPKTTTASGARADDDDVDDEEEDEEPAPRRSSRTRRTPAAPEPEPDENEDEEEDDEESEEETGEGYDLDQLEEELGGLTLVQLKKRAKEEFGFTASGLRGMKADDLIEAILEKVDTEQADDEEPEEEPEPPRRASRAKTAPPKTRGRRGSDDPPF